MEMDCCCAEDHGILLLLFESTGSYPLGGGGEVQSTRGDGPGRLGGTMVASGIHRHHHHYDCRIKKIIKSCVNDDAEQLDIAACERFAP